MLERVDSAEAIDSLLNKLGCRVQLPEDESEFLAVRGPQVSEFAEQRQFPRYDFREKAFLFYKDAVHVVYMKDISHTSLGFLHAEQVFPLDQMKIRMLNGMKFDVSIKRCLRLQTCCFECGGAIEPTDRLSPDQLRTLTAK